MPSPTDDVTRNDSLQQRSTVHPHGQVSLDVAALSVADDLESVGKLVAVAAASGARLIVLPELVGHDGGVVRPTSIDRPERAVATSDAAVRTIRDALAGTEAAAVTSVVDVWSGGICHSGVVISADGIAFRQRQLTASDARRWQDRAGDEIGFADMDWGRLTILVGEDAIEDTYVKATQALDADLLAVVGSPSLGFNDAAASRIASDRGMPVVFATRQGTQQGTQQAPAIASPQVPRSRRSGAKTSGADVAVPEGAQPLCWAMVSLANAAPAVAD